MNWKKVAIIGLIAGGGIWWMSRRASGRIVVGSPRIPFQKLTGSGLQLGLLLPVTNASGLGVTVKSFLGYIVDKSGATLATVTQEKPVQIPQFGKVEIPYTVQVSWLTLALEIKEAIEAKGQIDPKAYKLKGTLLFSGNVKYDIDQPLL